MPTTTVVQELLELENEYWRAIQDQDADTVMRLSDDPCTIAGAQGVRSIDRRTLAGLMKDTPYTLTASTSRTARECRCSETMSRSSPTTLTRI